MPLNSKLTFPKGHTPTESPTSEEKATGKLWFLNVQLLSKEKRVVRSQESWNGFKITDFLTFRGESHSALGVRSSAALSTEMLVRCRWPLGLSLAEI